MSHRAVRTTPRRARNKTPQPSPSPAKAVTLERAARLYRLVAFLSEGPRTRKALLQRLRIDIRTFYRDLEMLRECKIAVALAKRKYTLETEAASARLALPFPDPGLSLGEAQQLAKGRGKVHLKLREILKAIVQE